MNQHPSYLKLDRLNLGDADDATREHVKACARCQQHLGRLEQPVAVPAWARALPTERRGFWDRLRRFLVRPSSLTAIGALACAVAVMLVAWPRGPEEEYLSAKGSPSVAVYVKRDGHVTLWDGQMPLRAGDAVQLKVRPEGFTRVALASVEKDGLRELYQGDVSGKGTTALPQSFVLDAGATTLLLVFAREPVAAEGLASIAEKLPRTKKLWATRLVLTNGDRP